MRVLDDLIADFAARRALKAGPFIVTVYGDVALPRGGAVWLGAVIEACAAVGVNESQARTAVSRLVEAGRLAGVREGRRSYYRLTPAAAAEFARAAQAIHGSGETAEDAPWTLAVPPVEGRATALEALARLGFGLAAGVALHPGDAVAAARSAAPAAAVFLGPAAAPPAALAAEAWDLAALSAAYAAFAARFAPLEAAAASLDGARALAARLLMVHDFRRIALRDPNLPSAALPPDWAGRRARVRFRRLYSDLSAAADLHAAQRFSALAA